MFHDSIKSANVIPFNVLSIAKSIFLQTFFVRHFFDLPQKLQSTTSSFPSKIETMSFDVILFGDLDRTYPPCAIPFFR